MQADTEAERGAAEGDIFTHTSSTDAAEENLATKLRDIGKHCAALPDVDTRSPEVIVGYDDTGMW